MFRHLDEYPVVADAPTCPNIGKELRLPVETSPDGVWTFGPRIPRCSACGIEPRQIETVETWSAEASGV